MSRLNCEIASSIRWKPDVHLARTFRRVLVLAPAFAVAVGCQALSQQQPTGFPPVSSISPRADDARLDAARRGAVVDPNVRRTSVEDPPIPTGGAGERAMQETILEHEQFEEEKKGFSWEDLAPEKIMENMKEAVGLGQDEALAKSLFKEGEALYAKKEYLAAAAKFKKAASRWKDSPLEEDALFYLGECYFFGDKYPQAQDTFGELLKKYDNSRYLDTVSARQFAIGRFWEKYHSQEPHWPVTPNLTDKTRPLFDTFGNAMKSYELIHMYDPTGPLADDSVMAYANARFLQGRYEDAAYEYDKLRRNYPKSPHQMKAHVLGLRAQMEVYQGTHYDDQPLQSAKRIADDTLSQFGRELGTEYDYVLKERNRINEERARRDFMMAEYYEKRGYYGAAKVYYQLLMKEFPNTEASRVAQERLDAIADKPERPANHVKWLTDTLSTADK